MQVCIFFVLFIRLIYVCTFAYICISNSVNLSTSSSIQGDIARLIRLLEYYPAAKSFVRRWADSEGASFVGTHTHTTMNEHNDDNDDDDHRMRSTAQLADSLLRTLDLDADANPAENPSVPMMSKAEYELLKRKYNDDPFPVTSSFEV